jgi:hypothetical protein
MKTTQTNYLATVCYWKTTQAPAETSHVNPELDAIELDLTPAKNARRVAK